MNPVGGVILLLGLLLAVAGFKDKQDNLIAAVTGKQYGRSTLNTDQQLTAIMGVFLLILSTVQWWKPELKALI